MNQFESKSFWKNLSFENKQTHRSVKERCKMFSFPFPSSWFGDPRLVWSRILSNLLYIMLISINEVRGICLLISISLSHSTRFFTSLSLYSETSVQAINTSGTGRHNQVTPHLRRYHPNKQNRRKGKEWKAAHVAECILTCISSFQSIIKKQVVSEDAIHGATGGEC